MTADGWAAAAEWGPGMRPQGRVPSARPDGIPRARQLAMAPFLLSPPASGTDDSTNDVPVASGTERHKRFQVGEV